MAPAVATQRAVPALSDQCTDDYRTTKLAEYITKSAGGRVAPAAASAPVPSAPVHLIRAYPGKLSDITFKALPFQLSMSSAAPVESWAARII